ncbi:hypothetical protein APR04_003854 [Promicromonospora umidemergens]|uniref:Uncharacterized protein n=2 Tax=Promicromonospora TaxID=43676 RepID=A0ABP8XHP0_9MICO|nr:hypothetical protein [Promicromonospora umidemergens]MCP2284931.1 hypothetical protein [Promicromonospora umidemergens]
MSAVSSVPSPGQVDVADTSGTSIWDLDLDTTSGGFSSGVVDPLASTAWEAYRALVALTVWTLDQAIALTWAPYVLAPLAGVARATRYAVEAVNPLALMLIVQPSDRRRCDRPVGSDTRRPRRRIRSRR